MRAAAGFILIALFAIRMIFRAFITRDLLQKPEELYVGAAFTAAWVVIYFGFITS